MINFDQKMLFFRDTLALFSPIAPLLTQKATLCDKKLADFLI
jgi:hypothetical protein